MNRDDTIRQTVVEFVHHTPSLPHSRSSFDADQIGIAVSPPLPERNPSRSLDRKGKRKMRAYESINWSDEQGPDVDGPPRRLGRAKTG
jgi:hypothetical protein